MQAMLAIIHGSSPTLKEPKKWSKEFNGTTRPPYVVVPMCPKALDLTMIALGPRFSGRLPEEKP